jgi:hypothetical protein
MTSEYVLAYVPRKMKALGVNENYALSFRELPVKGTVTLVIEAVGQYYFLVAGFSPDISIESETGIYDQTASTNELQHEHTGKITIQNRGSATIFLQFIVVIPNN